MFIIDGEKIISAVVLFIVIISSIWVYSDAVTIGVKKGQLKGVCDMGPAGWFFACLGLWIISFPVYLGVRSKLKRLNQQDPKQLVRQEAGDFEEQLMKLARLKQQGLITEEEYTAKKQRILGLTGADSEVEVLFGPYGFERIPGLTGVDSEGVTGPKVETGAIHEPNPESLRNNPGNVVLLIVTILGTLAVAGWLTKFHGTPFSPQSKPITLPTKAEWRTKALPYYNPSGGRKMISAAEFKSLFGEPSQTQRQGNTAFWYYACADGTIQIEVISPELTGGQMAIQTINDY